MTNAQRMCYGTKHTHTRTHTSHQKKKCAKSRSNKVKKVRLTFCVYSVTLVSQLKPQSNVDIKEQPLRGYIVQIVDVKILVTNSEADDDLGAKRFSL